jgi:hypothetical protein
MEKDFHFYVTFALVHKAGFSWDDSNIIANSCQYVDDNHEHQLTRKNDFPGLLETIETPDGSFRPIITQSMSLKSFLYEIQKYVYIPFHLLPGDSSKPINGKYNKYSTIADSQNAKKLLRTALRSKDLYRIGIALHTYADTWSHQNFSGYEEDWNSVFSWKNPFRAVAPNIAHADVAQLPDEISAVWNDYRFPKSERKRDNRKITLQACKRIFQELRFITKGPTWSSVRKEFKEIIYADDYDDRIARVEKYLGRKPEYSAKAWLQQAINQNLKVITAIKHFQQTPYYKFQIAAKAHLVMVLNMLKEY